MDAKNFGGAEAVKSFGAPLSLTLGMIKNDQISQKEIYREGANLALAGYQLIEALLKTYIKNYFEIAKYLLEGKLHFGFTGRDYDEAPLGRLLQVFAKISNDKELLKDLRSEVQHRDQIAHRSMLVLFAKTEPTSEELSSMTSELEERNRKVNGLLKRLHARHDELISPWNEVTSNDS